MGIVVDECVIVGFQVGIADESYLGNTFRNTTVHSATICAVSIGNNHKESVGLRLMPDGGMELKGAIIIQKGSEGEYIKYFKPFTFWQHIKFAFQKLFK